MKIIILGLLCSVGCSPIKNTPALDLKPKTDGTRNKEMKWECFYTDGSNNQFHFYRKEGKTHFRYEPIQPMMSSSGMYSGGTAKEGILTPEQARLLDSRLQYWQENTSAHVERRSKGVGSFRISQGEGEHLFLIPEAQLNELSALLEPFRP
tara:strand:- start:157 stop:609 length:453 start_codon:yes stop_codon:yes gene_type:complete